MELYCNNCHKAVSATQACVCNRCGRIVCSDCARDSMYVCQCNGELNALN
ncbi:MAG: hypothetical protein PHX51_02755 [Clostridia bacterium]|nr:hypothetical protein [Clostridia bacterium]